MNTPEAFRLAYSQLGLIAELLIGNVIVGNYTWATAHRIAYKLTERLTK